MLLFVSGALNAAEMLQFGENVRSFGMGGVRVASSDDPSAFLWNPASLSYIKGINWELFNLGLGINGEDAYKTFKDIRNVSGGLSGYSQYYGKPLWIGAQGYSAFAMPYFGLAVYDQAYVDLILHNPAYPTLDMTYVNDYAFAFGGAVPLGPQGSLGVNVKRITRLGGPQQLGPSVLNNVNSDALLDQFQNEGVGYGLDAGLMYQIPGPASPTFGLAWQDVGSTAFIKTKGAGAPERIKDNLTFSTSVHEDLGYAGFAAGIEYRHITDANEQLGKKIHMGAELSLAMIDLRAGFYQGYTTYGAGVDLWIMQLDAATYTVEKGAYPGQTPQNRLQVGLSMSFGFDPDFKLTDVGGKRRRLKQRR